MAFEPVQNRIATTIGPVRIYLIDPDGTNNNRSIKARIVVLDQSGEVMKEWTGDLQPHLTTTQLTRLASFLDDLRTQAETELL